MRTMIMVATCMLANAGALAQPATQRIQYEAAWFAQFAPRNAFDMVSRTPGFVLVERDEERRGYSGAVGNVLVDGARPSAKEQTVTEILRRIPASQVVRIELLRGAEAAADASGEAMLANVVRTRFTAQGFWTGGFEHFPGRAPAPNAFLSWTGRARSVDFGLGAGTYSLRREFPGDRDVTDGSGALTGRRVDTSPREFAEYSLNGEMSADLAGGRLRVTGQGNTSRYHEDSTVATTWINGDPAESEFNPYTERKRSGELGAHFERRLGRWNMTAVALLTRTRFESDARSTQMEAAAIESFFLARERDSGESILRTTLARDLAADQRLEIGLEGALNTLDARLHFTVASGADGEPFEIVLPNSNLEVEERRSEAFVAHVWRPAQRWSLESRLAGEVSRLGFTGDTTQSVELAFAKPAVQLVRTLGERNQLRLRMAREVGQLDFTDFVAAASLADERIDGGNPDLRPETSWLAELGADFRFRADVALGISVFHRGLDDTLDLIPVVSASGERSDAAGNIGAGRVRGLKIAFSAPLAPLIRGGTFAVDATLSEAEVRDPLTGRTRTISEFERVRLNASLRQDLPVQGLTWGLDYKHVSSISKFRQVEVDTSRVSPSLDVFTEFGVPGGMRLKLAAVSVLGSPELRTRTFFAPDRNGLIREVEAGERRPRRWFQLFLSGSF